jgi:alkanesulfonate monooxygenase SsuD/methylene tetrahydromethanopterin reductase-like flavin-dependent oxidoreductase (luciferase family)
VVTLQRLSGDRLLLGVGSGGAVHGDAAWRAVGLDFRKRGRQTDDALEALPGLVAGRPTVVGGEEVTLSPAATMPPVLIAASEPTLDRVARYGDEWYPAFTSTAYLASTARRLADLAAELGRPAPGMTLNVSLALGDVPPKTIDDYVKASAAFHGDESGIRESLLTGTPADAAEQINALAEAGVHRIVGFPITPDRKSQAHLLAQATHLANGHHHP